MDAQKRIDEIKAQSRERSQRYYKAHQAEIAERRKQARLAKRNEAVQAAAAQADWEAAAPPPPPEAPAPPAPRAQTRLRSAQAAQAAQAAPVAPQMPIAQVPRAVAQKPAAKANSTAPLTLETAIATVAQKIDNVKSRKSYISALKTVRSIIGCVDIKKCFTSYKKVIKSIETAKKENKDDYSINSKKIYFQTILKLNDLLELELPDDAFKAYREKFEEYCILSNDQTEKRKSEEVMDYDTYLEQVKKFYGKTSKEFIVASLYQEDGFRDDLQLKIVREEPKTFEGNLLIVPEIISEPLTIILTAYKTSGRYGKKTVPLSMGLSKLIRQYIKTNKIPLESYLFGDKELSSFVSKFNTKMGLVKVTINTLRHMGVASILNQPNLSAAERAKLARKYNHSPGTNLAYNRNLKKK